MPTSLLSLLCLQQWRRDIRLHLVFLVGWQIIQDLNNIEFNWRQQYHSQNVLEIFHWIDVLKRQFSSDQNVVTVKFLIYHRKFRYLTTQSIDHLLHYNWPSTSTIAPNTGWIPQFGLTKRTIRYLTPGIPFRCNRNQNLIKKRHFIWFYIKQVSLIWDRLWFIYTIKTVWLTLPGHLTPFVFVYFDWLSSTTAIAINFVFASQPDNGF